MALPKLRIVRITAYNGEWVDGRFVTKDQLQRSDLINPAIKPSFIIHLSTGDRVLIGWTDKGQQRQFFIKEAEELPKADPYFEPSKWALKVIRMRGKRWIKILNTISIGMTKWFQGKNPVELVTVGEKICYVNPMRPMP